MSPRYRDLKKKKKRRRKKEEEWLYADDTVYSLIDSLGLSYIWSNQIHTIESFKRIVKQRLMDQFIKEWQSRVAENSVCSNYHLFKKKFCFEK